MLVDRSATQPRAWPPASAPALVLEQLRCAMLRDRFGHWCQTLLACLFAFASAINHAPLNIASAMLITCALIRLHASWRAMPTLLRCDALAPCALLTGWLLLSLLWTSAQDGAISDLSILRWVIILPALWPVLDHARAIAVAFILGTAVQNGAQLLQLADLLERPSANPWRHAGIVDHPGDSALRSAMTVVLATGLAFATSGRARIVLSIAGITALCGVLIAAGRGQILALAIALPFLFALLWRGEFISKRTLILTAVIGTLICASLLMTVGKSSLRYLNEVPEQLSAATDGMDATSPVASRLQWWSDAQKLWAAHPVCGNGLGSFASRASDPKDAQAWTKHPHNSYLGVLCEGGLIGFALLAWMLWVLLRASWQNARRDALACGACAALVVVLVSALTSDPQYREMSVASTMVVVALGCLPIVRGFRN